MDTDIEKVMLRARIWGTIVLAMTLGVWDLVEESATSLSPTIGDFLMSFLAKQFGLKIKGVGAKEILEELGEAFVTGLNYADSYTLEQSGNSITVTLVNAVGTKDFAILDDHGVKKQFSHPFYCAGLSALKEAGHRARGNAVLDVAANNQVVTFDLL